MKLMGDASNPFAHPSCATASGEGHPMALPATPRTLTRESAATTLYTAPSMVKPRVDKLLDHADSNYAAVVVSAKRARQINSYFHNLGEGGFGEYPPPMVETNAEGNYLTMALEELAEGKLKYEYRS
jgi:DNA-directed RNA polymerase subunit omega